MIQSNRVREEIKVNTKRVKLTPLMTIVSIKAFNQRLTSKQVLQNKLQQTLSKAVLICALKPAF